MTLVYRGENILRGFDDDVRAHLRGEMERRGIKVITGAARRRRSSRRAAAMPRRSTDGRRIAAEKVMFAIGRKPNIAGLGLEARRRRPSPTTAASRSTRYSRTAVPHIYAVGDVTNRVNLTPVAIREGHALADTLFGGRPTAVDHVHIPTAVFSEPEIGVIGLTETQARERLARVDIYKRTSGRMKATSPEARSRVLMKLVVDAATDRVVGCHIVGEGAGEMIQLIGIAVKMGATKADFDATMAVHPTAAEELVTMREPSVRHLREAAE